MKTCNKADEAKATKSLTKLQTKLDEAKAAERTAKATAEKATTAVQTASGELEQCKNQCKAVIEVSDCPQAGAECPCDKYYTKKHKKNCHQRTNFQRGRNSRCTS